MIYKDFALFGDGFAAAQQLSASVRGDFHDVDVAGLGDDGRWPVLLHLVRSHLAAADAGCDVRAALLGSEVSTILSSGVVLAWTRVRSQVDGSPLWRISLREEAIEHGLIDRAIAAGWSYVQPQSRTLPDLPDLDYPA